MSFKYFALFCSLWDVEQVNLMGAGKCFSLLKNKMCYFNILYDILNDFIGIISTYNFLYQMVFICDLISLAENIIRLTSTHTSFSMKRIFMLSFSSLILGAQ